MFNKSKKYGIVKCLPFVCFADIKATEAFISGKDQIIFMVNGKEYVLWDRIVILKDNTRPITLENLLNVSKTNINYDLEQSRSLPFKIEDINDKKFKLISYQIGDNEIVSGDDVLCKFNKVTGEEVGSNDLTLTFERVYKLSALSKLSDGKNIIDLGGKEILNSDLRPITNLDELFNFINTKFAKDTFGNNVEGCLSGKTGAEIDKNKFFISLFNTSDISDGKFYYKLTKSVIEQIKLLKFLDLQFSPYINYKIEDIKLSKELSKTRKLKDDISDFKTACNGLLKKQLKKLTLTEIGTIIKGVSDYKDIDIKNDDPAGKIEEGKVDLVITAANDKISQLMKGTIKFEIDHTKDIQYDSHTFAGNNIDVIFGKKIKDEDIYAVIDTSTNQDIFKGEIKKYLGNIEAKEETYSINFASNFGTNNTDTAKDDFVVVVTFKGKVNGFTKEKDKEIENINIKLDIDDNASCDFQLETGLQKNYNSLAFNKNLDYNNFITELEKKLGKGTGTLATAIKEVKYNNGKADTEWKSGEANNIEGLGIKSVTITLNKEENGNYVKKVVLTPPAKDSVTFTLNVTTSVNGYKVKAGNEKLTVTVPKASLNYHTLFNAIQSQIGDNKFKIMKCSSTISDSEKIDITNTNAYSINLEEGSSLLDKNKKDDNKDNKGNQTGDNPTEDDTNKKSKVCCCGKCSGGNKREK